MARSGMINRAKKAMKNLTGRMKGAARRSRKGGTRSTSAGGESRRTARSAVRKSEGETAPQRGDRRRSA